MVYRFRGVVMFAVLLAGSLGLVTAGAAVAHADPGCYGGYVGGYGTSGLYTQYSIPYFALHPPVYYSYPVPRTYGYSPWAYPPGVMTPEVEVGVPQNMINPHVPRAEKTKPTANRVTGRSFNSRNAQATAEATGSQVVINPFVSNSFVSEKLAGDQ